MTTLLAFATVIGVLIAFHEFGHFLVAKLSGIFVKTFSFGFPPKLLKKRIGETQYALGALLFGGYVKMAGESTALGEEEAAEAAPKAEGGAGAPAGAKAAAASDEVPDSDIPPERYFCNKPLAVRLLVVTAGPIANLLLALVVFTAFWYHEGIPIWPTTTLGEVPADSQEYGAGLRTGDVLRRIAGKPVANSYEVAASFKNLGAAPLAIDLQRAGRDTTVVLPGVRRVGGQIDFPKFHLRPGSRIGKIKSGGPAARAGLQQGDRIVDIDGHEISSYDEIAGFVNPAIGKELRVTWDRGGERHTATMTPEADEAPSDDGKTLKRIGRIQVEAYTEVRPVSLASAAWESVEFSWGIVRELGRFFGTVLQGHGSRDAIGGPIRIAQEAGSAARWELWRLLYFVGFVSLNLFLFNLLPIPILDGGHVLFLAIEAVRGRALSLRTQERLLRLGFVAILLLIGYATFNDLVRVFAH